MFIQVTMFDTVEKIQPDIILVSLQWFFTKQILYSHKPVFHFINKPIGLF